MNNKKKSKQINNFLKFPKSLLAEWEIEVLQKQIRANSFVIDYYIHAIDLLVNKERCPKDANTLVRLRNRLSVAIEENDTFRRVLWCHAQSEAPTDGDIEAVAFLIGQIKTRRQAAIAQLARKS